MCVVRVAALQARGVADDVHRHSCGREGGRPRSEGAEEALQTFPHTPQSHGRLVGLLMHSASTWQLNHCGPVRICLWPGCNMHPRYRVPTVDAHKTFLEITATEREYLQRGSASNKWFPFVPLSIFGTNGPHPRQAQRNRPVPV